MKRIDRIIQNLRLRPGDAVVINKTFFDAALPYAIYLGRADTRHQFFIRVGNTLRELSLTEIRKWFLYQPPRRINRFVGNTAKRRQIIGRFRQQPTVNTFALILNHCEDYSHLNKGKGPSSGALIGGVIGAAALIALGAFLLGGGSDDDG